MRVRVATSFGLATVTVLTLSSCSAEAGETSNPAASSASAESSASAVPPQPLSSADLEQRLLDESDLGAGYVREPESLERYDDVTVLGCPELKKLGGEAATGGALDFPRQAEVSFTYTASSSEVAEELYSAGVGKLSTGMDRVFEAMTSCPEYKVLAGSSSIEVTTQKMAAPQLGDEEWSQLLTFSAGGRESVVKQTAIRSGAVLLVLSGSPALVDRHLEKVLDKATAHR